MKKSLFFFALVIFATHLYCQVGIGTTTPSPASMLEIAGSSDGGTTYKGFMPPRVPDVAARDAINPTIADVGLSVFVENSGCLQIWNGTGWESMHCINNTGFVDLFQNFDLNTTWGYSSDIAFFDNGSQGFYGITNSSNGGFSNINTLTNNFLGILDLDDTEDGNGTSGFATITFTTINVSNASAGVTVSFQYQFYQYDNADDAYYRLIIDGVPQTEVQLIAGGGNNSVSGTVSVNVPGGTTSVSLVIRIRQNGQSDYAGFDNFAIIAN
jgi:hypothetical protein